MRKSLVAFVLLFGLSTLGYASPGIPEKPLAEWTFITYLNGDNNLDSFGAQNIEDMEKVGSTDGINVVVQWASLANGDARRMLVKKSTNPSQVTSPVVQNLGKVDMGDFHSFVDFADWAIKNYPAKHYAVNIWDHGGGWHLDARSSQDRRHILRPMDISWDDNSGNFITTQQLGQALAQIAQLIGHKIDLYGSDACMMGQAEVASEVANSVQIFAGSEETEPGAGWPYSAILTRWTANPTQTAAQVGTIIAEEYTKSYQGGSNGTADVTFSAMDISQLETLQQSMAALAAKIQSLDAASRAKVITAATSTQEFAYADYGDLLDFVNNLSGQVPALDRASLSTIRDAISKFVISNHTTSLYAKAGGVSIWLPTDMNTYSSYSAKYGALLFEGATHWSEALQAALQVAPAPAPAPSN